MAIKNCQDCDYVSESVFASNGKCSACHGTGYEQDLLEAVEEKLAGGTDECKVCGGSGTCRTCDGKGYIDTGLFDNDDTEQSDD